MRLILILTLFISIQTFGQIPTGYQKRIVNERIQGSFMVDSAFNIPRYYDTTAANLHKRSDSCGAMFFAYGIDSVYYRACNPKRWVVLGSGSGSGNANAFNVTYDAREWGMVSDGVTDNTSALQAIMDDIESNGWSATIQLDTGVYIISGALQDITNSNSQIMLPSVDLDDPTISVTIKGRQVPPNQFFTTSTLPIRGFSTIKSTLTGASGTASVISGHHEVGGLGAQNNVALNLYDIIFEVPPNPTLSAINLRYHQAGSYDGVLINAGSVQIDDVDEPTNSNAYGIIFPEYNHTPSNNVGRLDVWGFYYGWRISERTDIKVLSSWACYYTGELAFGNHASTAQVIASYWCRNGIKGTGATSIRIMDYQMENILSGWQTRQNDIDDASNYITGDLYYQLIHSGGINNDDFIKVGGSNLICKYIGQADDDTCRILQYDITNSPPLGNHWLDTISNRQRYKVVHGSDTTVYTLAIWDSTISSIGSGTILIEDAFTGSNGTDIDVHTIAPTNTPVTSWTDIPTSSAITIQSNKASSTPGAVVNYVLDAGVSDCVIEVILNRSGSVDAGVMFRYVDDGNYWLADFLTASNTVKIYEKTGGSYTERATISKTFTNATDFLMTVTLSGDDISVKIDGGSEITYNSSVRNTATKHGLWTSGGGAATITWDDFTVSSSGGGSTSFGEVNYATSANLPLRITNHVASVDTSYAYDPSLTTNKRSQQLADSLGVIIGTKTTLAAVKALTKSKGVTLESPTSSEDFGLWQTQVAITVSSINAVVIGSSPSVTINIAFGSNITSLTNVFSSGTAITNTTTGQTISSGFNDATIPAGSWIRLISTASSGTITQIEVTINYTED